MARKSFYVLELSVDPGGCHKAVFSVRATLPEIQRDLAGDLATGLGLYHLCWYGEEVALHVYQHGDLTATIDLHPYITIRIPGYPEITFDAGGRALGYDFESDDAEDDTLAGRMFADELKDVVVDVAWDRIEVPELKGEIVGPEDLVNIDGDWLGEEEEARLSEAELRGWDYLPYGQTDLEA